METAFGVIQNTNQDTLTFKPVTREYPSKESVILPIVSPVFDTPRHTNIQFARIKANNSGTMEAKN